MLYVHLGILGVSFIFMVIYNHFCGHFGYSMVVSDHYLMGVSKLCFLGYHSNGYMIIHPSFKVP